MRTFFKKSKFNGYLLTEKAYSTFDFFPQHVLIRKINFNLHLL